MNTDNQKPATGKSLFVDDGWGVARDSQGRPLDEFYYDLRKVPPRRRRRLAQYQSEIIQGLPVGLRAGKAQASALHRPTDGGRSSGATPAVHPPKAGSLQNFIRRFKEVFHDVVSKKS
jgi:hypothetical protein